MFYVSPHDISVKFEGQDEWRRVNTFLGWGVQKGKISKILKMWYGSAVRAGWSRVRVLVGAGNLSPHHRVHPVSGAHPAFYSVATRGSFGSGNAAGEWSWSLTSI